MMSTKRINHILGGEIIKQRLLTKTFIKSVYLNLNIRHLEHALRVNFYKCQSIRPST
jgi:hypothetical protein